MLFDKELIKLFDTDIGFQRVSALQFKLFCNEEKLLFFNFNTYPRISLCARVNYLRYV